MGDRPDPWSGGGERTRAEVREIFERHAERGAGTPDGEAERRKPLPNFLLLPGRIWRVLPAAGKAAFGLALAGCAVLIAVLVPAALDNAGENQENQRRAAAANLEEIRLQLVEEQRPRRADLPVPVRSANLAAAVGSDYERRVRAGDLEGPAGATTCRAIRRTQARGSTIFTCLAERGGEKGAYRDRSLVSGYRFRARVALGSGAAAWCKENPRPLHADQEEFVVVPLSRACTG